MQEIRALTGLRGIAACIVFAAHLRDTLEFHGLDLAVPELVKRLFLSGGRQVDIFFVLSGFILALTYRKWFEQRIDGKQYFEFLRLRFARIEPLHFVMILLVLGSVVAATVLNASTTNGLERFDFSTLPAHVLLVHAWGFLDGAGEWNPPSWSISIEALAYLIFPMLLWVVVRAKSYRSWLLLAGLVAIGFGLNWVVHWNTHGFGGVARGLSEFALGCAALNLCSTKFATWLQSNVGSICAVLALLIVFALTPDTGFVIAVVTVPLLLAFMGANPASILVGSPVIYFLGQISYSIYLGHFLFSSIAYRIVSIPWMGTGEWQLWAGVAAITGLVVAASTLTYYIIERPGRRLLRGARKPRSTDVVAANQSAAR